MKREARMQTCKHPFLRHHARALGASADEARAPAGPARRAGPAQAARSGALHGALHGALVGALSAALGLAPLPAAAQQATERFIPLGQSPGISGKTAMMGTVVAYSGGMLTLSSPAYPTPQQVRVTPATLIWLDRTALRESNVAGSPADLLPGRRIEIRFVEPTSRAAAAWIKVEAAR